MRIDENNSVSVGVPDGVEFRFEPPTLFVKGPNGEVSKLLRSPMIEVKVVPDKVTLRVKVMSKREKKMLGTFVAHINNMIKGVTEAYVYKLKVCSGHFPMSVQLKDQEFRVTNFLGEKFPRLLKLKHESVKVEINGDTIVVTGIDREGVAQTTADIEELMKRSGFDKRIFQDGIYIIEKDGKPIK